MKAVKIIGTGKALCEGVLTNAELEQMVDTSDAWVVECTGIRERRIADEHTATSYLVAEALIVACKSAEVKPEEW